MECPRSCCGRLAVRHQLPAPENRGQGQGNAEFSFLRTAFRSCMVSGAAKSICDLLPDAQCLLPTADCLLPSAHRLLPFASRKSRSKHRASIVRMGFPKSKRSVELFEAPKRIAYGSNAPLASGRLRTSDNPAAKAFGRFHDLKRFRERYGGRCQPKKFCRDLTPDGKPFTRKDRPSKSKG